MLRMQSELNRSLELKIGSLKSVKIILRPIDSNKIRSLESEKSGLYKSTPGS